MPEIFGSTNTHYSFFFHAARSKDHDKSGSIVVEIVKWHAVVYCSFACRSDNKNVAIVTRAQSKSMQIAQFM